MERDRQAEVLKLARKIVKLCGENDQCEGVGTPRQMKVAGQGASINEKEPYKNHPRS